MNIRNATSHDAEALCQLVTELHQAYTMSVDAMKSRICAFEREFHQLWVCENLENIITATVAFGFHEMLHLQGRCCVIDSLVVGHHYRGQHIGKMLVEKVEEYAAIHGCTRIELITANHRKAIKTHDFYQKMGFQDHIASDCTFFKKYI